MIRLAVSEVTDHRGRRHIDDDFLRMNYRIEKDKMAGKRIAAEFNDEETVRMPALLGAPQ